MKHIDTLGIDFVHRHEWLLNMAKDCEVAICGGCAAAISKDRSDYVPADLDLVATKGSALRLVDNITHFLLSKQVHFRIYVNSQNDFVPEPAIAHFRIQCPFWAPICLFVLPDDKFRYYRIKGGYLLQLPSDVKQAADALTETDQKPRLANEPFEFEIDLELNEGPPPEEFDDVWTREEKIMDESDPTFIIGNPFDQQAGSGKHFK